MNRPTVIDQQLKTYLEKFQNGGKQADAILDQLMDRYNLTSDSTDGFFDSVLTEIHEAQVKAEDFLYPTPDRFMIDDGHQYGVKFDNRDVKIGEESWNPTSGCPVEIHEGNLKYAKHEYWAIVSVEEAPEVPKKQDFKIVLKRTSFAYNTLSVRALTYEEAVNMALDGAESFEYEKGEEEFTDYEVEE